MCILEYIVTFRQASHLRNNFCRLYAHNYTAFLVQANTLFRTLWSTSYSDEQSAGVNEFNLQEISGVHPWVKVLRYAEGMDKPTWHRHPLPGTKIQSTVDELVSRGYLMYRPEEGNTLQPHELLLTSNGRNFLKSLSCDFT